jgi:anti-anti-sigma regulatory factor/PAS domain-containing protein
MSQQEQQEQQELETLRRRVQELESLLEQAQAQVQANWSPPTSRIAYKTYEKIFDQSPLPMVVFEVDGTLADINQRNAELLKVPLKAGIGLYNLCQNEEAREKGHVACFEQALAGQVVTMPAVTYDTVRANLHGEEEPWTVWTETTYFPILDTFGVVRYVGAINQDVTERKDTEDALRQSQQNLQEISTPLVPLSQHILLMPLVGHIDSRRAQVIMEKLLEGIAQYQAEVAILDITGVPLVDTQVADALLKTAQATRLLGATIILTGIGPQMARTLVQLGAEMSHILTRGTLQSGIATAQEIAVTSFT